MITVAGTVGSDDNVRPPVIRGPDNHILRAGPNRVTPQFTARLIVGDEAAGFQTVLGPCKGDNFPAAIAVNVSQFGLNF